MTQPTQEQIDKFVKHCIQQPRNALDAERMRSEWKPGHYEYIVRKGESLKFIASKEASRGSGGGNAPEGFDWKFLCRFNWGVDFPPYVNWSLVDAFGLDDANNLTKDKKNYTFKGGEKLLIPYKPGGAKPGPVAPVVPNVINKRKLRPTAVKGPSIMTPGIESEFIVTGYSAALKEVPDETRKNLKWWIKNITDGGDGEDAGVTGEKVLKKFTDSEVGKTFRMYPFLEDKNKINELVHCQFRILKVELKHEISRQDIDDKKLKHTDPINKIHNPPAVIIGANTKETAAKFRLTKVEPDSRAVADQKFPWPALPANDDGFKWRIKKFTEEETKSFKKKNIPIGEAKFVKVDGKFDNTGSECLINGTAPGFIVLEAWADCAKQACAWLTLKCVNTRELLYRVNLLTSKDIATKPAAKTNADPEEIEKNIKAANIYLRQIGVALAPDSTATKYPIGAGEEINVYQKTVGTTKETMAGFYEIKKVPNQYVEIGGFAGALAASKINARPGVVNYVFAARDTSTAPGFVTLGIAPTAIRNLHTFPKLCHKPAPPAGMTYTYKGPDQTVKPEDDAKYKEMKMFDTPDSDPGRENYVGVVMYNPPGGGGALTDDQRTKEGATTSHELGHCAALRHRGGNTAAGGEGEKPDLLDSSQKNMMFWLSNNDSNDLDLVQLEVFRASYSLINNANRGNLTLKPFLPTTNKLTAEKDKFKSVNIEVTRRRERVKGAYLNFWIEPDARIIKIEEVKDWDAASRKMKTGMVRVKIKFRGNAGQKAKLVVMAGHNDDLTSAEIPCEII